MSGLTWILTSLLAVSLIGDSEVGGLATAILGGIAVALSAILEVGYRRSSPRVAASGVLHSLQRWVVANELWIVLLVGPLFAFPRRSFVPIFAIVPLLGILRWRVRGQLTRRTPLDVPILLLLVMLAISVLVSADLDRSLPKLAGMLWGVAAYYAIVNWIDSRREVEWLSVGMAAGAVVLAVVVLIGTKWFAAGKFLPSQVYDLLPNGLIRVPGTIQGWIHPNEAGGSLALLVPFLAALLVMPGEAGPGAITNLKWREKLCIFFRRWGLVVPLLIATAVLVITQSRSALFGVGVALLLLFAIRWRPFRWVFLVGVVVFLVLDVSQGSAFIGSVLVGSADQGGAVGTLDFVGRQEVWQRALYAIQDFPFTGVGLNMFDPVVKALYPLFLVSPDVVIEHAHDNFLQVALDVGIPGLVAYVALLSAFGYVVWFVFARSPSLFFRAVAVGLGLGMLAHQIFGLTDAVTLGSKPGIIFWVMLAVAAGLWTLTPLPSGRPAESVEGGETG